MPKRKRRADTKLLRKCPKLSHKFEGEDPFTLLNDDIIQFHILSRLSLEEAARTSVLSRRWRKLWTGGIGSKVIFSYPCDRFFHNYSFLIDQFKSLKSSITNRIRHVLETIKPTFNELTVNFDYDESDSHMIDGWVKSALHQRVTRLELDFSPYKKFLGRKSRYNYTFPGIDTLSAWHAICGNLLHQPAHRAGLYNLTDVCLKFINVSVEVINCMLSNCPSLERLSLWKSWSEQKYNVSIQSSNLKSLEFVRCKYELIEISAPNLVSLQYDGKKKGLHLVHVPLLSELSIGEKYSIYCLKRGAPKFSYFSQLRRLTLEISPADITELMGYPLEFPELVRLEQLEITLETCRDTCLLWLIILIKAAPFLQKFTIWFNQQLEPMLREPIDVNYQNKLLNIIKQVDHQCLNLIELRKFSGTLFQMELGQQLLGISQSLKQVAVWPYIIRFNKKPHHMSRHNFEITQGYCKKAQQLKWWLPPTAKLDVHLPEIYVV